MIPKKILDSIASRFLIDLSPEDKSAIERLFFILEEAHWFVIDNYSLPTIHLIDFCKEILDHTNIKINVSISEALSKFKRYRQSIKVYGAILVNPEMTHVLVVKELTKTKNYSFPKGKKCMNESGIECAIREVYEEIGYNIQNKICNIPITIFNKITFYFVFNVKETQTFKSQTKKEIGEIRWMSMKELSKREHKRESSLIVTAFIRASSLLRALKKSKFKFDVKKINERIDQSIKLVKKQENYK